MPRYESSSAVRVVPGAGAPQFDWELLYDLHAPRLRRIIQRKVGTALVEDVLQETFLRAFKSRHTIDPTRPIAPWLITIALRTAADAHRNQLRSIESVALEGEDSPELALDALEEELLTRARRIGIKHAFAGLNNRQRRLLELVAVDGLTYESAAGCEEMTTDAVKSALARARTNFRTSYVAFTRESGLFGAAGVGGWLLKRLRFRTRRSAVFIGHHAAGFGAATLSVAVVAAVAIPAVAPLPSQARTANATTVASGATVGAAEFGIPSDTDTSEPSTVPASSDALSPADPASRTRPAVGVDVHVDDDTNGVGIHSTRAVETPVSESRSFTVAEIFCDGAVGAALCQTAEVVPSLP